MSKPVRILGIAGSLRRESYNRAALREATKLLPEDATLDIFELDGIPGFNQDEEQNPPAKVVELKRRVRESDAILIVTPEYNYLCFAKNPSAITSVGGRTQSSKYVGSDLAFVFVINLGLFDFSF
jgi:NADPH-dependent FMN reductase